jgi:Contractile injection system spike tip protein
MADFVIKTSDLLQVTIPPPAIVPLLMAPVPLIGTGLTVMINNQPACLQGDEFPPTLRVPLVYTAPPFVTPGMGTLTLILMPNNMSMRSMFGGKPALLKGATFQAMFNVTVPAMQPTPVGPIPDPVLVKPGIAQFITSTVNVQVS